MTEPQVRSTTAMTGPQGYLAFSQDLCKMEQLGIRVTDDGFTLIDPKAKPVNVAVSWQSLDGFRDLLVDRLVASGA